MVFTKFSCRKRFQVHYSSVRKFSRRIDITQQLSTCIFIAKNIFLLFNILFICWRALFTVSAQNLILNNNKKRIIFRSSISLIVYTFRWILPLITVAVLLDFKKRFNSSSCISRQHSKCCSSSSDSFNLRSVNKCSFSLRYCMSNAVAVVVVACS